MSDIPALSRVNNIVAPFKKASDKPLPPLGPDVFVRSHGVRFGNTPAPQPDCPEDRRFALTMRVLDDALPKHLTSQAWAEQLAGLDLSQPIQVPEGPEPVALHGVGSLGTVDNVHAPSLLAGLWIQASSDKNEALEQALLGYMDNAIANSNATVTHAFAQIGFNPKTAPISADTRALMEVLGSHPDENLRFGFSTGIVGNPLIGTDRGLQTIVDGLLQDGNEGVLIRPLAGNAQLEQSPYLQETLTRLSSAPMPPVEQEQIQGEIIAGLGSNPTLEHSPFAQQFLEGVFEQAPQLTMKLAEGIGSNPNLQHSTYLQQRLSSLLDLSAINNYLPPDIDSTEIRDMMLASALAGLARNPNLEHSPFAKSILTSHRVTSETTDLFQQKIAQGLGANPSLDYSPFAQQMLEHVMRQPMSDNVQRNLMISLNFNPRRDQSPLVQDIHNRITASLAF